MTNLRLFMGGSTKLQKHLISLGACQEARDWAAGKTYEQAWNTCKRPDWLLWWAVRTEVNTQMVITRAACDCARLVLHLVKEGENRPLLAIEAAELWAENPTTKNKLACKAAADAVAYAAVVYVAADAAAYAAAAYAADADAYIGDTATSAAYAAVDAYADATADAYTSIQSKCCKAIRARLVCPCGETTK